MSIKTSHGAIFQSMAEFLDEQKDEILKILTPIATYQSILDEIERSKKILLSGAEEILREDPALVKKIAVFHSSNVLLYSYMLYGVIPSAFAERIYIRPSLQVKAETFAIHRLFQKFKLAIEVSVLNQKMFIDNVSDSDVAIFTGKYENSIAVKSQFHSALFLFFGSGANATVLGEDVDVDKVLPSLISSRLFNSGQDCLCSNIFFLPESISGYFLSRLKDSLSLLKFSTRDCPLGDYSSIFYQNVTESVSEYLQQYSRYIVHQGKMDVKNKYIDPVVLFSNLEDNLPCIEFFAPVFNLVVYKDIQDVIQWLMRPENLERALGLSVYGNVGTHRSLANHYMIAHNQTLFAVENGNLPFGGYGIKANYVSYKGKMSSYPILISREIAKHFGRASKEAAHGELIGSAK